MSSGWHLRMATKIGLLGGAGLLAYIGVQCAFLADQNVYDLLCRAMLLLPWPGVIVLVLAALGPAKRHRIMLAVVVGVQSLCACVAFYVISELASIVLQLLVWVSAGLWVYVTASADARHFALVLVTWAVIMSMPEVVLSWHWYSIRREADPIIQYVEAVRHNRGVYPPDLAGYRFSKAQYQGNLRYDCEPDGSDFALDYFVVHSRHFYSPTAGWSCYPD